MTEITDKMIHDLAESIIDINCIQCKEFYKPVNNSECWCDAIGEIVTNELFFLGSGPEDERVNDENRVAAAWEEIQKRWLEENKQA